MSADDRAEKSDGNQDLSFGCVELSWLHAPYPAPPLRDIHTKLVPKHGKYYKKYELKNPRDVRLKIY